MSNDQSTTGRRRSRARDEAIANGLKTYHGSPCSTCGSTKRYVVSCNCVSCENVRRAKYRQNHQALDAAIRTQATARGYQALPVWSSLPEHRERFTAVLAEKFRLIEEDGKPRHLDHIVPYRGVTAEGWQVRGLHVWWNVQVLKAQENIAKGNKLEPDTELDWTAPWWTTHQPEGIA